MRRQPKQASSQLQPEEQAPVQARARRTRAQIIEVAAAVFAGQGYDGTSLNDIIRASGLTKGAFYFHFRSKEHLALAVFRAKQSQLISGIREAPRPADNALLQLQSMLRARARLLVHNPSLRGFPRIASDLVARSGAGSEFAQSYELPIGTLSELIRAGQQQGIIRSSFKPRIIAEVIFEVMLGADELTRMLSGGADLERRTEEWLEVILAVLSEPARLKPPRRITKTKQRN